MLYRLVAKYLRPYMAYITAVLIFQLAQTLASLWLPTINADIIDQGVAKGDTAKVLQLGALMLGVTLVQVLCSVVAVYFSARAAMLLGRDIRRDLFTHVNTFSEREVRRFGAPSLITRNTNDVQQVQMLVLMAATMMVSAPMMAIGGVIMAIRQDPVLSWLIAVSVPVLLIILFFIVRKMVPLFRQMQRRIDAINQVMREQLSGIRVIRAFVREPKERRRFDDANASLAKTALGVGRLFAVMFPLVMLILDFSSVAVVWLGAYRIESGGMQVGSLFAFLMYIMQILTSVMMAAFMVVMIPRAAVCADRINEVLTTDSTVVPPQQGRTDSPTPGLVEFEHVEFRYPGADAAVLSDVTFSAHLGQTTAIVGSTGSGKSTLIGLIPRLFDTTAGTVRIDGVDVRELDLSSLWARIGYVPQAAFLFSGTVADNLRYGNQQATDDELWAALETAQAAQFVREMPGALEAPIAQGGTNVSGGQRQRLAIARALVRGAEIEVFDDSFSALDTETDARLRSALGATAARATRLIVAQRVSSIRDADQIIVLDSGRIVGRGTHAELLASCQTYREIVASQMSEKEAA